MNKDPIEMMNIETPSTSHLNFSPKIKGDNTAVENIETHMVEDVSITFPSDSDTITIQWDKSS